MLKELQSDQEGCSRPIPSGPRPWNDKERGKERGQRA